MFWNQNGTLSINYRNLYTALFAQMRYKVRERVTSKNGKHGVQNMENTESDVKYGKHGV